MSAADGAQVAALVGAAGSALVLLTGRRLALAAGFLLLLAAEVLLGLFLIPEDDLRALAGSPVRAGLLAIGGTAVIAGGVALARFPAAVPVVAALAAPFRVPLEVGAQKAFLLVPLYGVVAAAVVALLIRSLRSEDAPGLPRVLAWAVSAFVVVSAASLLWSHDLRAGAIELFFFLFPFVALVAVVARSPVAAWLARALAVTVVALGLAFAGVGIWQLWSERLFFARDLETTNAYTSYFRTASLFADSNLYGRELVVSLLVVLVALWAGRLSLWIGAPLVAALWAGLYFTYSQSSMVALVVAAFALTFVAADRRARRLLVAGSAVFVLIAAGFVAVSVQDHSQRQFTSGRSRLVEATVRVFLDRPLIGTGIGAQPKMSSEEPGARPDASRNASHTTPLTVAAELGVVGIAAYAAFLLAAVRVLTLALRRRPVLALGLAAAFAAAFVHSLFYAGFFQNPLVWGVLAVAAAALAPAGEPASAPTPEPAPAPAPAQARGSKPRVRERWQT